MACALGFVDFVGSRRVARDLAARLTLGEAVSSPRQDALAKRPVSPAVLELEAAMRPEAAVFEREAMQGEVRPWRAKV